MCGYCAGVWLVFVSQEAPSRFRCFADVGPLGGNGETAEPPVCCSHHEKGTHTEFMSAKI